MRSERRRRPERGRGLQERARALEPEPVRAQVRGLRREQAPVRRPPGVGVGAPTSSISTKYWVPSIEILNLRSMAALLFHLVDVLDRERALLERTGGERRGDD